MKKKMLGSLAVLAMAAMAAFNLDLNTENSDMPHLSLANIEALAQESNTLGCTTKLKDICSTQHKDHHGYRNKKEGE